MRKREMVFRGHVYKVDLGGSKGSEQGGIRPCVVVQNDVGNRYSTTTIVLPLTSQEKAYLPTHFALKKLGNEYLYYDSICLAEQIRTVDKERILSFMGEIDEKDMRKIDDTLRISLAL